MGEARILCFVYALLSEPNVRRHHLSTGKFEALYTRLE